MGRRARMALAIGLSLATAIGVGYRQFAAAITGPLFSLLATGSTDQSSVADLCDTYASSMTGSYWCLRGDGTSTGQTLTATGSPTTETRSYCGNGSSCGNVTKQRINGTASYFSTATGAGPPGSYTIGVTFSLDVSTTDQTIVAKQLSPNNDIIIEWLGTAGTFRLIQNNPTGTNQTLCSSSATSLAARADNHLALAYTYVADGTSTAVWYFNGVANGTCSSLSGPATRSTSAWFVGRRSAGANPLAGTVRNAFATESALSVATILAMSNTALGKLTPATGQALTFTRTTTKTCENAAGSEVTWLPPNRPCVTQGGVSIEGAATNLALRSEEFDNATWTKVGSGTVPTVTANNATAPDGTQTADTIVFPAVTATANAQVYQPISAAAGTFSGGVWLRNPSGSSTIPLQFQNSNNFGIVTCNVTTTWSRCKTETATTAATNNYLMLGSAKGLATPSPDMTAQTLEVWGAQVETGSFASSYIATTSATVARTAEALSAAETGVNANLGCAAMTFTPFRTGSNPSNRHFVSMAANVQPLYAVGNIDSMFGFNGTNNPFVAAAFTAGTAKRYRSTWSTAANQFIITNEASAASNTTAFSGFAAPGSTIYIGNRLASGSEAWGLLSNIKVDVTTDGCL